MDDELGLDDVSGEKMDPDADADADDANQVATDLHTRTDTITDSNTDTKNEAQAGSGNGLDHDDVHEPLPSRPSGSSEPEAIPGQNLWDRIWGDLPTLTKLEDQLCKALKVTRSQDRFLISTALNFIFIFAVVLLVDSLFLILTRDERSLYLYQKFLVWFIVVVLQALGQEGVSWYEGTEGPILILPEVSHGLEIASACTGLRETLFIGLLVLLFRDVRLKVRIKWIAIFALVIFIENIIRILSIYPVEQAYDFDTWDRFHYYWWNVGQFILIMTLFLLWVHFVAHKDIMQQKKERKRQKELMQASAPSLSSSEISATRDDPLDEPASIDPE